MRRQKMGNGSEAGVRARGTHAEEECGDSRVWYENVLVATRDVVSYALVTPASFPVESTRVLFFVSTV